MAKNLQLTSRIRSVIAAFAVLSVLAVPLVLAQTAPHADRVVSADSGADAPVVMQVGEIDWP